MSRAWIVANLRRYDRHVPIGVGDRREEIAYAACDASVADAGVAQGAQRDLAMKWHAVGCAHVRLHRLAEPAISIAIREDRGGDSIGMRVEESVSEHRALQEPRIAPEEIGGTFE